MSVFKVNLNNIDQGRLDVNPLTGEQMQPSIQRTLWATGPNRIYRKLKDGEEFTDCNYWKQFAYPQVPLSEAFIEVVTDDGSIYSSNPEENTFPFAQTVTVLTTDTFETNYIDVLGTYNSYAVFTQIENLGTTSNQDIDVQLNGLSSAEFGLANGAVQTFNRNDLTITRIAFEGGSANTTVQLIMSVQSVCNS